MNTSTYYISLPRYDDDRADTLRSRRSHSSTLSDGGDVDDTWLCGYFSGYLFGAFEEGCF